MIMKEIHEREGGNHSGARSFAHYTLCQGYFWPYMHSDIIQLVKKYDKCQRFADVIDPEISIVYSSHRPIGHSSSWDCIFRHLGFVEEGHLQKVYTHNAVMTPFHTATQKTTKQPKLTIFQLIGHLVNLIFR